MNQAFFTLACAALLIAPQAFGARDRAAKDTAAKDAAAKEAAAKEDTLVPANVPPYVLKNRSKFDIPSDAARIPFWPVGWTKQKQAAIAVVAAEPKVTLDERNFHVSSILISGGTAPSLAVINERPYGEGEFLRMPKGSGPRILIRVERIKDGVVILEHEGQKIQVPLRRPSLNQHKDDTELLNPDR